MRPLLLIVLVCVLTLALAPAALAKSEPVAAEGDWTWENTEWNQRDNPSGNTHLWGYETGFWTGTFTADATYEPYVASFTKSGELWAKLWIHFEDATVDMGGEQLQGDMTMLVMFKAGKPDATWMIHNGSGGLQHLGGEGTLLSTDTGMHYTGTIWTQK